MKRVFGNRVVIEPIMEEQTTASGILIPGKDKQKKLIGKVIAVGTGLILNNGTRMPMEIEVGSTIMYRQYAGLNIKEDGKDYIVLEANDVIAEI